MAIGAWASSMLSLAFFIFLGLLPNWRSELVEAIRGIGKPVKRILIVDDDPDVLQLWTRMLNSCDDALEIVAALSGEEALAQLRAGPPDLVLLDILMPDVDGWQVLELKRQDEAICDIPVVLVSAQDPTERPPASEALLVTIGEGISLNKLFHCSLEVSARLLKPE